MMRCLVGAALLVGCYKNTAPPPPPAQRSPVAPAAQPVRDYRGALADPVGFLPADSELVLAIDGDQLRKSPMWSMAEQRIRTMAGAKFTTFTASCGFDPLATIRNVTLGLRGLKNDQPRGVVVITGMSRPKLTECLERTVKASSEITMDKDVFVVRSTASDPTSMALTFVDEATAVVLIAPTADRAALTKVLSSGTPLRRSPAFTQLLAHVDTSTAIWGIANGHSSIFDVAGSQKPSAVWGSIRLDNGASVALRIRFSDASVTQQLATVAQTQLTGAQMFFDRLDVTADGVELVVEADIGETKLASLMTLMGLAQQAQTPPTAPTLGGP